MPVTLADLVKRWERELWWEEIGESYHRLRGDQRSWRDYQNEQQEILQTSGSGLATEPPYPLNSKWMEEEPVETTKQVAE